MNPGGSIVFSFYDGRPPETRKKEEAMEKNGGKKEEAKYKFPGGSPIEFHAEDLYTLLS